jgi:hypothetical protein
MNRWRVGEDRGSKEMDGCPLTRAFSLDFPWLGKCCTSYLPSFIYLLWISLG